MKKNLLRFLSLAMVAAAMTFTSCTEDACADVDCGDNGTCFEGDCVCNVGYEGADCATLITGYEADANGNATLIAGYELDANGVPVLMTGYELDANGVPVQSRAKFIGTWTVADDCSTSGTASYVVTSTGDADITKVSIANFWGVFTNAVIASVDGDNISIERQEPDGDKFFVVGTGEFKLSKVNWSYTISDETNVSAIQTDNCTSTWTKN